MLNWARAKYTELSVIWLELGTTPGDCPAELGSPSGRNRWVEYAPAVGTDYDGSMVPAEWYGWLHHKADETPDQVSGHCGWRQRGGYMAVFHSLGTDSRLPGQFEMCHMCYTHGTGLRTREQNKRLSASWFLHFSEALVICVMNFPVIISPCPTEAASAARLAEGPRAEPIWHGGRLLPLHHHPAEGASLGAAQEVGNRRLWQTVYIAGFTGRDQYSVWSESFVVYSGQVMV